jgi:adenylate cyclase, class 2
MEVKMVEVKAKCSDQDKIRELLQSRKADFQGLDHQIDTYFKVPKGRLKLREGNIENYLISYQRENTKGAKESDIKLFPVDPHSSLKAVLKSALEELVVVDKKREIYFIDNIKFHLDSIEGLGTFVEIEARDTTGKIEKEKLWEQCNTYKDLFQIKDEDMIDVSYSDLILKNSNVKE